MEQMGMMMANIPMPHRQPMFASALSTMNAEQQPGYLLFRTGYHSLSTSRCVNRLLAGSLEVGYDQTSGASDTHKVMKARRKVISHLSSLGSPGHGHAIARRKDHQQSRFLDI
jgi:hypothetical protein